MNSGVVAMLDQLGVDTKRVNKVVSLNAPHHELVQLIAFARRVFNFDKGVAEDIFFLHKNRERYIREVLVPPAHEQAAAMDTQKKVEALIEEREDLLLKAKVTNEEFSGRESAVNGLLGLAYKAMGELDPGTAKEILQKVEQEIYRDIEQLKDLTKAEKFSG